jgi:hypothetical protein
LPDSTSVAIDEPLYLIVDPAGVLDHDLKHALAALSCLLAHLSSNLIGRASPASASLLSNRHLTK